jgi:hypothetical protein
MIALMVPVFISSHYHYIHPKLLHPNMLLADRDRDATFWLRFECRIITQLEKS